MARRAPSHPHLIPDYATDKVYDTDHYVGLVVKHGKKPPYKAERRQQDIEVRSPVLKIGQRRTQQPTKLQVLRGRGEKKLPSQQSSWGDAIHIDEASTTPNKEESVCEFIVILPQATINSIHAALKYGGDVLTVFLDEMQPKQQMHTGKLKTHEKTERQTTTDHESFKLNSAFPLIKKFEKIFLSHLPKGLPVHGEHEMELTPRHRAIFRPQWRLSPEQTETLRAWLREMLDAGLIHPSISPHGAPTFYIKKPVGWRIVHDYRAQNEHTIRQSTPMPRKDDILDRIAGCRWFSCFDLLSGYYQIRMREKEQITWHWLNLCTIDIIKLAFR